MTMLPQKGFADDLMFVQQHNQGYICTSLLLFKKELG